MTKSPSSRPNLFEAKQQARQLLELMAEELADDDERQMAVDTETDFSEALSRMLGAIGHYESLIAGIAERKRELDARKSRFEAKVQRMKAAILSAIDDLGLPNYELPEAKLIPGKGRDSVLIVDVTRIPKSYMKIKEEPDKTALASALKSGVLIPGVSLTNGGRILSIRKA